MAAYALALLVALLIAGSLVPVETKLLLGTRGSFHRPLHIFLFVLTGLLARLTFRRVPIAVVAAVVIGFGLSLELAERFCYTDAMEWWDVFDDAVGCVIGVTLSLLFRARK